jgi:shikimate kinase
MAIVRQFIGANSAVQRLACKAGAIDMSSRSYPVPTKPIVFVGMMGAGKSAIGRRVADRLNLEFMDADNEIESAAGCSIPDIFERHGEEEFREGERRVILRLLEGPVKVIATGGGAFMNEQTRAAIKELSDSVWLRADFETLWRRVSRRDNRPMLKTADPRGTLKKLIDERYPTYSEADLTVESTDGPRDATVDRVIDALEAYWRNREAPQDD